MKAFWLDQISFCISKRKVGVPMRNATLYYSAIVVGIISIIIGVFYQANIILGYHPSRAYFAFAIGAILLIVGIAGAFVVRRKG